MSPRCCNKSGFTLIEVLIGTVLLATLAVSVLLGFRNHQRQLRFSEDRIEAITIADRLMTQWTGQPGGIPVGTFGVADLPRQWGWRTFVVDSRIVFGQPTWIVRMEVYETLNEKNRVLVGIDFVQPQPSS